MKRVTYCLMVILPLLAITSASLVRVQGNHVLALSVPCVTALMVIILVRSNVPGRVYPLTVFSIALSLVVHSEATLGSDYLYGGDIQAEYHCVNFAMVQGWQSVTGTTLATSLSITIFWAELSRLFHIDPVWLYKILSPLFLSLVPLMLYFVYEQQIGNKRAFLAAILFTSLLIPILYYGFRVVTGEFFLALCLLLLLTTNMRLFSRISLLIVSSVCLIFSYYALGIFYSCILVLTCALLPAFRLYNKRQSLLPLKCLVVVTVITVGVAVLWYSSGEGKVVSTVDTIREEQIGQLVAEESVIQSGFLDIKTREQGIATALGLDFSVASSQGKAFRVVQILIEIFVVVGLLGAVTRLKTPRWNNEFVIFGLAISFVLLLCAVLPHFSAHWESVRFYQASLFVLSPFCVVGGEAIFNLVSKLRSNAVLLVTVVIVTYFLFQSGFVFEATKSESVNNFDIPSAGILSSYRVDNSNWKRNEYEAMQWFLSTTNGSRPIYGDAYASGLFSHFWLANRGNLEPDTEVPQGAFILLREYNTETGRLAYIERDGEWLHYRHGEVPYSDSWEKIYSVGQASIYRSK